MTARDTHTLSLALTHSLTHSPPIQSLYENAQQQITGPIQFRHSFVDFSKLELNVSGEIVHTCPPAMGEAFAAGTTDGPGAFDFRQGRYYTVHTHINTQGIT